MNILKLKNTIIHYLNHRIHQMSLIAYGTQHTLFKDKISLKKERKKTQTETQVWGVRKTEQNIKDMQNIVKRSNACIIKILEGEETRDLFKKIRDTKGTFHAKMSSIKDRNGMDLREAEDSKKRWQEYTEEQQKKDLHDPGNHDGVITHLEPDILVCKGKWALGSITTNKVSGGDGIPLELFQILKDDAVKVLY